MWSKFKFSYGQTYCLWQTQIITFAKLLFLYFFKVAFTLNLFGLVNMNSGSFASLEQLICVSMRAVKLTQMWTKHLIFKRKRSVFKRSRLGPCLSCLKANGPTKRFHDRCVIFSMDSKAKPLFYPSSDFDLFRRQTSYKQCIYLS